MTVVSSEVEPATHTADVHKHLRGMFRRDGLYMAMWAVQIGAAAAFTPITTRVLGAGQFGQVAAASAVMMILVPIAGLQLQAAVQRRYAEPGGDEAARRLVGLTILLSVTTLLVAMATGPWWSKALGFPGFTDTLKLAVAWASVTAVTDASLGLLRSRDLLLPFGLVSGLQSIAAEAVSLALVLGVERSARAFLLGQLICQVAGLIVALVYAPPLLLRRRDFGMARTAMIYSVALVPSALGAFVLNAADRLVIQAHLGSVQTGRYQAAYNVGAMPIILLGLLNTVWMPRVFALKDDKARAALLAASRDAVFRVLAPVVIGLSIAAPVVLRVWVPASYHPDRLLPVVAVVVVSAVPYAHTMSSQRSMLAAGNTWALAWSILVAAAVNLGLNLVMVPVWGLMGSALATLISFCVLAVITHVAAGRQLKVAGMPPVLVLMMLGVCGVAVASAFLPTAPIAMALRLAIGVACLGWMLLELRTAGTGRTSRTSTARHRRETVNSETSFGS